MEKVQLPGLPARRAADYRLDGFTPARFARVIYTPQEAKPDRRVVEAQAFEVDADGRIAAFATGAASRTPGTTHVMSMTGVGDTHTLVAGWVRCVGSFDPDAPEGMSNAAPAGTPTEVSEGVPVDAGTEGDYRWVRRADGVHLYRWDPGWIETLLRSKAEELAGLLRSADAVAEVDI